MNITLIGHIYFCEKLADKLRMKNHKVDVLFYSHWGKNLFHSLHFCKNADVIHFICGRGIRKFPLAFILRFIMNKKLIVHFVGSDVLQFKKQNFIDQINWKIALLICHRIFTGSPQLKNELDPYVKSTFFHLIYQNTEFGKRAFPVKCTVLSYIPKVNPIFYGYNEIKSLIKLNNDVNFIIITDYGNLAKFSNVQVLPFDKTRNMSEIYSKTSILIRLTDHDGLCQMVLEALSHGCYVLWTSPFLFCNQVSKNADNVNAELQKLKKITNPNFEAINWCKENLNSDSNINELINVYKNPKINIKSLQFNYNS